MASKVTAGQIIGQVTLDFSQATQAINTQGKAAFKALGATMGDLSNGFQSLSQDMFRASMAMGAMSTTMVAMIAPIAKVGYEFDKNMSMVRAVTNASAVEMENLSGIARSMGEQTFYGAVQAAEGLLILSKMGLSAGESMQVLGPAMMLAQSQQEDMAMTTELLVQQLKTFGKSMDEAASFANTMAAISAQTAADIDKLNVSLAYAGPIARTVGVSFEEVNTVLGMMYNNGIKASTAGTGLRFALNRLVKPT